MSGRRATTKPTLAGICCVQSKEYLPGLPVVLADVAHISMKKELTSLLVVDNAFCRIHSFKHILNSVLRYLRRDVSVG